MVDVASSAGAAAPAPVPPAQAVHLDWAAVIAGSLIATAVSFVLHSFGAAIGLSVVSPFGQDGVGGLGLLIGMALWVIWVTVSSFMLGAYIAGRMRRRAFDATEHESDLRDGAHGLTVWALGVVLGAMIFASGLDTAARTGAAAVSGAAQGIGKSVETVAGLSDSPEVQAALGRLLRPAADATGRSSGNPDRRNALQGEFSRMLSADPDSDGIADEDRSYMSEILAQELGLSEEQAEARIEQLSTSLQELRSDAEEAARTARIATVLGAFVLAASLLIAGAGAWWAAGIGGRHRDERTVVRFLAPPRR